MIMPYKQTALEPYQAPRQFVSVYLPFSKDVGYDILIEKGLT